MDKYLYRANSMATKKSDRTGQDRTKLKEIEIVQYGRLFDAVLYLLLESSQETFYVRSIYLGQTYFLTQLSILYAVPKCVVRRGRGYMWRKSRLR